MQKITMSEWRTALDALQTRRAYRPPGSKTLKEIAVELDKSLPSAQRYISTMLEKGIAKMVMGTIITVQNAERKTPYYVLVKGTTKCPTSTK